METSIFTQRRKGTRKIKLQNKVSQERINCLTGTHEFFEDIDFKKVTLPVPDQEGSEVFYVLGEVARAQPESLELQKQLLMDTEEWKPVLFQFVPEALKNDWLPFELRASGGQRLVEDEALTLNECGLVPAALLTFSSSVLEDMGAAGAEPATSVLRPELLAAIEQFS
ncbi:UBX domain-containing protein 6 [Lemmus lemmus]